MKVEAAPMWQQLYLWVLGVMLVQLVLKLSNMGRDPKWALDLTVRVLSVGLLLKVIAADVYFVALPGGMDVSRLNNAVGAGFRVVMALCVVDLVRAIWRVVRERTKVPAGAVSMV